MFTLFNRRKAALKREIEQKAYWDRRRLTARNLLAEDPEIKKRTETHNRIIEERQQQVIVFNLGDHCIWSRPEDVVQLFISIGFTRASCTDPFNVLNKPENRQYRPLLEGIKL